MLAVPYDFVEQLAAEFGAVDCNWRESKRSFTGFVAEVWFNTLPGDFATKWAAAIGHPVQVRCISDGPSRFAVSVPVEVPSGLVKLGQPSRGSRVKLIPPQ